MPKCHLRHFFCSTTFLSVGSLHRLEIHRNAPQPPPRADPTPSTCSSYLLLSMVVILEPPWGWIPAPSSPRCQFWVSWSAMKARLNPIACLHRPYTPPPTTLEGTCWSIESFLVQGKANTNYQLQWCLPGGDYHSHSWRWTDSILTIFAIPAFSLLSVVASRSMEWAPSRRVGV